MSRKKKVDTSTYEPWNYKGLKIQSIEDCPAGSYGFVYLLEDKVTGKLYVGKKALHSYHTIISYVRNEKTGRMNKVRTIEATESNWKDYFGSHAGIVKAVRAGGKSNFIRTILRFVPTKKLLTYWEMAEMCKRDVLISDSYYNDNILGKFVRSDFSTS